MTKQLTIYEKEKIIEWFHDNIPQKNIAKYFKIFQAAVSKVIKRYKETDEIGRKKESGRPKKLSCGDILNIKKSSTSVKILVQMTWQI